MHLPERGLKSPRFVLSKCISEIALHRSASSIDIFEESRLCVFEFFPLAFPARGLAPMLQGTVLRANFGLKTIEFEQKYSELQLVVPSSTEHDRIVP